MNSENINFPDVDFEIPETSEQPPIDDGLREKLISLAEKGNYSPKYIQKASRDVLEKIKIKYDRKISEKSSKIISNLIVSKLSDLLEKTDLIESSPELKQELGENELFKEELHELVNDELMPLIPKIGMVSGGVIVAEHIIKITYEKTKWNERTPGRRFGFLKRFFIYGCVYEKFKVPGKVAVQSVENIPLPFSSSSIQTLLLLIPLSRLSFLPSLTFLNDLIVPLPPSNTATIPPSTAITMVEGNTMATVTPPAIKVNFNNVFPTNFNFFLLVFSFIFDNSVVNSSFNSVSSSSVKLIMRSILFIRVISFVYVLTLLNK